MDFIINILMQDKPSDIIRNNSDEIFKIIPELFFCKDFNQNNIWHIYDVFEHILHVIDGVPNNLTLRIAALFHDIGKPFVYKEDENGVGHFFGHWDKSNEIFCKYAERYKLKEKEMISNLILYHDVNLGKIADKDLNKIIDIFGKHGIIMLFHLKRSDLLAQNKQFHYVLGDYENQKIKILNK